MTTSRSDIPHFGSCIKRAHAKQNITQREVALKIGMDPGNYSRLINRASINASMLWVICHALDVPFGDIVRE